MAVACGVFVHPVFLFIDHPATTRNFAFGPGAVYRARQRAVTKGLRPIAPLVWIPMVNDNFHCHPTTPHTGSALRFVRLGRQTAMPAFSEDRQGRWNIVHGALVLGASPLEISFSLLMRYRSAVSNRGSVTSSPTPLTSFPIRN